MICSHFSSKNSLKDSSLEGVRSMPAATPAAAAVPINIQGCSRVHSRRLTPCARACFMSDNTRLMAALACSCWRVRKSASLILLLSSAGVDCGFAGPLGDVVPVELLALGLFSLFILLDG